MPIIRSKNTKPRARRPARIAPGMATVAVLLAGIAACGGNDDDTTAASGPDPGADTAATCWVGTGEDLEAATWTDYQTMGGEQQPAAVVVLEAAYALPALPGARIAELEAAPGGAWASGRFDGYPAEGLVEYPDGNLGLIIQPEQADDTAHLVVLTPDGAVVDEYDAAAASLAPEPTLDGVSSAGYMRVEADSIEIPASATGDEANQAYVIRVMATSDDSGQVWALLRGSDQLYRGTVYASDPESMHPLGERFDTASCT